MSKMLFLILVLASCNSQNKIIAIPPKLNKSQYDVIPIMEIKEVFRLAIELPELQKYFHIEQNPERAPLKVMDFGDINSRTLKGITKFGQPIKFLSKEELASNGIKDYLGIGDWSPVNGKLRLQMYYPIEGITINYMFEKRESRWQILDSLIREE